MASMPSPAAPTMRPSDAPSRRQARSARRRGRRVAVWLIGGGFALVFLCALFVGVAFYTDQPSFCASCHEMKPYVDAWASGPHNSHWCVDCHVGQDYPSRLAHKFVALQEVVAHFAGDTKFPRQDAPVVSDARCSACHKTVSVTVAKGFDHAAHASQGSCQACHADSGHNVTPAALTAANVFNPAVVRIPLGSAIATVGAGSADVPGHVQVVCTNCHDLKKTGCKSCHTPNHTPRGDCQLCHAAGVKWVFTHPTQANCQLCHKLPSNHFKPASGSLPGCTTCHTRPGKTWAFAHPAATSACGSCHAVPANHFKPASASLSPCTTCHKRPGVAWKFSHPGSSANCQSCHTPPSGHPTGQCSTCHHKTGVSFAFVHPSTGMPGTSGIACVKCHPSGYATHTCTCHGGGSPV